MNSIVKKLPYKHEARKVSFGLFSWILMCFCAVKFSMVYTSSLLTGYFITYNISAIIFLCYFFTYFRHRFNFLLLLLFALLYNVGIHLFLFIYHHSILIHPKPAPFSIIIVTSAVNLIVFVVTYFPLKKIYS